MSSYYGVTRYLSASTYTLAIYSSLLRTVLLPVTAAGLHRFRATHFQKSGSQSSMKGFCIRLRRWGRCCVTMPMSRSARTFVLTRQSPSLQTWNNGHIRVHHMAQCCPAWWPTTVSSPLWSTGSCLDSRAWVQWAIIYFLKQRRISSASMWTSWGSLNPPFSRGCSLFLYIEYWCCSYHSTTQLVATWY